MQKRLYVSKILLGLSLVSSFFAMVLASSLAFADLTAPVGSSAEPPVAAIAPTTEVPATASLMSVDEIWEKIKFRNHNWQIEYAKANRAALSKLENLRRTTNTDIQRVKTVKTARHTVITTAYTNGQPVMNFLMDDAALKNPDLWVKDLTVFAVVTRKINLPGIVAWAMMAIDSPHSWIETYADAKEGSVIAQYRLKQIELLIMEKKGALFLSESLGLDAETTKAVIAAGENSIPELRKEVAELEKQAVIYKRHQEKKLAQWRKETQALEKYEAMDQKLNDLVVRNDRKGVRDMLEAYLPWAVMEPMEIKTWKIWLEAIEHPDWSHTTIGFRGVDFTTDKIQKLILPDGKEQIGMLSTVLTKNQGSYTRRLRSLAINREANGDEGSKGLPTKMKHITLADQMSAHSRNPQASSFLSFTYNPRRAFNFVGQDKLDSDGIIVTNGAFVAVEMDSRRLFPNISTMYNQELELLAPLIVFPDEIISYKTGFSRTNFKDKIIVDLLNEVKKKTGKDFADEFDPAPREADLFTSDALKYMKYVYESKSLSAPLCSSIFL